MHFRALAGIIARASLLGSAAAGLCKPSSSIATLSTSTVPDFSISTSELSINTGFSTSTIITLSTSEIATITTVSTTSTAPVEPLCIAFQGHCVLSDQCCGDNECLSGECSPPPPACTPNGGPCDFARPDLCCGQICTQAIPVPTCSSF